MGTNMGDHKHKRRCGARQCGAQSNGVNILLKVILYHFFTYEELESVQQQPQLTKTGTNTATMVAKTLIPPAIRI
jgi:hypothetical protein